MLKMQNMNSEAKALDQVLAEVLSSFVLTAFHTYSHIFNMCCRAQAIERMERTGKYEFPPELMQNLTTLEDTINSPYSSPRSMSPVRDSGPWSPKATCGSINRPAVSGMRWGVKGRERGVAVAEMMVQGM
jgi:hypothetical protein